jgi:hypothetical protein
VGSYAEGVKQSTDPVAKWMRQAGTGVKDKASGAWDGIRGRSPDETPPADEDELPPGPEVGPDGVIDL